MVSDLLDELCALQYHWHCKVWSRLGLRNGQYRPRDRPPLRARLSTAPYRTPHVHAFPFRLARLLSPASSRRPPCAIGRLPPQIVIESTLFPSQPSQLVRRTPKP